MTGFPPRTVSRRLLVTGALLLACAGSDWPRFRGPNGTGVSVVVVAVVDAHRYAFSASRGDRRSGVVNRAVPR